MAVYALTSLSGAPGVTTLAIAWAYQNTRPTLILEADPTGGSPILAGPFRGNLLHDTSVLLLAERDPAELQEWMWHHAIALPETTDRKVLPAVASHAQARALAGTWPGLADTVQHFSAGTGTDVLLDLGRLTLEYSARALLPAADAVLVLTSATLPGINTVVWALDELRDTLQASGDPDRLAVVPVRAATGLTRGLLRRQDPTAAAQPWSQAEIARAIDPTAVLGPLPWRPEQAQVYAHATLAPKDWTQGAYSRAVSTLMAAAADHVDGSAAAG
ncbi:hypothetical protein [Intrasporangium sp.]|uniref:hypothetical protein n=1 Tax=Intrasporangium sp. TaxID=1925024 RepID=UPI003221764E